MGRSRTFSVEEDGLLDLGEPVLSAVLQQVRVLLPAPADRA